MKIKYYVENEKGDKVLVRTSANDYRYALVGIKNINNGDKRGLYCCSGNYDNILKQYNYYKKLYTENVKYLKTTTNSRYTQEEREKIIKNEQELCDNLEIVELVRG